MIEFDRTVHKSDARPAGKPDECFYCRAKVGQPHREQVHGMCVILRGRKLEATPIGVWQPIETYEDGDFVLFWFPEGERGAGGMETAMAYRNTNGSWDAWSHGGPNSGYDFEFCENPTMWCRLPEGPK